MVLRRQACGLASAQLRPGQAPGVRDRLAVHRGEALAEHAERGVCLAGRCRGRGLATSVGGENDVIHAVASDCCASAACRAIAVQEVVNAAFFSATIRSNSLRSRGDSFGPASAMRVTRCATTCGTATASSAAFQANDGETRLRREGIVEVREWDAGEVPAVAVKAAGPG